MRTTQSTARSTVAAKTGNTTKKSIVQRTRIVSAIRPDGEGTNEETTRLAAYAYYEARGSIDGHALDDWLAAKAQIEQSSAEQAGTAVT